MTVDQLNDGGTLLARNQHYFYGSARLSFDKNATEYPAWQDGREYKTESLDANGSTVLRRAEHTFQQRAAVSWWAGDASLAPPNDTRLTQAVSTLVDANQVAKQIFAYSNDLHNNQTDITDARGITATYTYDAINRNTGVTYSSYPNGSSGSVISYDNTDPTKFGKGRFWYNYNYARPDDPRRVRGLRGRPP